MGSVLCGSTRHVFRHNSVSSWSLGNLTHLKYLWLGGGGYWVVTATYARLGIN